VGGTTCADVDYEKVRSTLYGGSDQEVATLLQVRIGTEFQSSIQSGLIIALLDL
jgi:hypothetical protein